MAGTSVRPRGTGDPEATLGSVLEKPRGPKTAIASGGGRPPKSIQPQHKHPAAAVLPRGTKTRKPASLSPRRAPRLCRLSRDMTPGGGFIHGCRPPESAPRNPPARRPRRAPGDAHPRPARGPAGAPQPGKSRGKGRPAAAWPANLKASASKSGPTSV